MKKTIRLVFFPVFSSQVRGETEKILKTNGYEIEEKKHKKCLKSYSKWGWIYMRERF